MIKGKATIQIIDEKSGETVREIHEENMITNAVDTILNPPDANLSVRLIRSKVPHMTVSLAVFNTTAFAEPAGLH